MIDKFKPSPTPVFAKGGNRIAHLWAPSFETTRKAEAKEVEDAEQYLGRKLLACGGTEFVWQPHGVYEDPEEWLKAMEKSERFLAFVSRRGEFFDWPVATCSQSSPDC